MLTLPFGAVEVFLAGVFAAIFAALFAIVGGHTHTVVVFGALTDAITWALRVEDRTGEATDAFGLVGIFGEASEASATGFVACVAGFALVGPIVGDAFALFTSWFADIATVVVLATLWGGLDAFAVFALSLGAVLTVFVLGTLRWSFDAFAVFALGLDAVLAVFVLGAFGSIDALAVRALLLVGAVVFGLALHRWLVLAAACLRVAEPATAAIVVRAAFDRRTFALVPIAKLTAVLAVAVHTTLFFGVL